MSNSDEKKHDKNVADTISPDSASTNDSVNSSLIEKILCEMKNEFNRSDENSSSTVETPTKGRSNSCDRRNSKESGRKSVSKSTRSKSSSDAHAETSKSSNVKNQTNESGNSLKLQNDSHNSKAEKGNPKEISSNDKSDGEVIKNKKPIVLTNKKGAKSKQNNDTPKSPRLKNSQEKKVSLSSVKTEEEVKSNSDLSVCGKTDVANPASLTTSEDVKVENSRTGTRQKSAQERKGNLFVSKNEEGNKVSSESDLSEKNDSAVDSVLPATLEAVEKETLISSTQSLKNSQENKGFSTAAESEGDKINSESEISEKNNSVVDSVSVISASVKIEKETEILSGEKSQTADVQSEDEKSDDKTSQVSENKTQPEQISTDVSNDNYEINLVTNLLESSVNPRIDSQTKDINPSDGEDPKIKESETNLIKLENLDMDETKSENNNNESQKISNQVVENAQSSENFASAVSLESESTKDNQVTINDLTTDNDLMNSSKESEVFAEPSSSYVPTTVNIKVENEEEGLAKSASDQNVDDPCILSTKRKKENSEPSVSDSKNQGTNELTPRIILTLKTTEEQKEGTVNSSKGEPLTKKREIQYSISVKEEVAENLDEPAALNPDFTNDEGEEVRSRRIFRNRDAVKTEKLENDNSVKRSSRRTSKEFSFESVLQNAIARKEKSFGTLNGVEDRQKRSRIGSSDLRQSPRISKAKANKTSPEVKKGDSSVIHVPDELKPLVVCDLFPQNSIKTSYQVNEVNQVVAEPQEEDNVSSAAEKSKDMSEEIPEVLIQTDTGSKTERDSVCNSGNRSRKRKRYFRGFRYSLKSGVAKLVARSKKVKNEDLLSLPKDSTPSETVPVTEITKSETSEGVCESSSSTTSSESNLSTSSKRKYTCDPREDEINGAGKLRRMDVPSPSTAEGSDLAAVPESSAISIGGGTAAICLCQVNERVFVSPKVVEEAKEIYCQAIDSLDFQKVGCCNTVDKENREVVMLRPSVRIPYQPLCNVHFQRLIRHNCCPGCGLFCTQGRFVQCELLHHYHRECELMLDGKPTCPHCGQDSPKTDVMLSLGEHKNPVFFPLQKPPKTFPSARMCIGVSSSQYLPPTVSPPPPIVPVASLLLPNGTEISSEGMPPSLDKDKLDELLHAASQSSCLDARITYRTLYQASKNGETDKVIAALGAGLNPNHMFREWVMGSALHGASVGGHIGIVHILVQAGAQLDVIDRDQNTPLILAAENSQNEVVKYLVKAGASLTFKGEDGMTALHLAAKAGNLEACHYILSSPRVPADFINLTDDGGWTPLVWAAEHCHTNVVRFLLEKNADSHIRDAEQNIALHWATYSGSTNIAELLLDYGSELNCTNTHGDTPLHIAARRNHYDCVILLLARGALTSIKNKAGYSVLESCVVQPSDTHRALQLNTTLQELASKGSERTQVILTTDITRGHETNPIQCLNGVDDETEPTDYVYVTENCFTSNISVVRTITSLQSCTCSDCSSGDCACGKISFRCWYDKDGRLLPEFNYTDPPMLFECNQACKCNKVLCTNRVVQKGITGRFQLFRTKDNKGWGVITLKFIPKGTYVCEYIGEIISDYEADTREDDSYLFDLDNRDDETYCIDARRYGNIARFINHSCVPNLQPVRVFIGHQDLRFPRIAFFANRDIHPYEELGFDYGEKFWIIKYKSFTCTCKAKTCRYSVTTIRTTLDNYNKKIQEMENS